MNVVGDEPVDQKTFNPRYGFDHLPVARALGEEGRQQYQQHSLSVSGRAEEDIPSLCCVLLFESDRVLDLGELRFGEMIIGISIGMIL